jgi:hypothetical protein
LGTELNGDKPGLGQGIYLVIAIGDAPVAGANLMRTAEFSKMISHKNQIFILSALQLR